MSKMRVAAFVDRELIEKLSPEELRKNLHYEFSRQAPNGYVIRNVPKDPVEFDPSNSTHRAVAREHYKDSTPPPNVMLYIAAAFRV